MDQPFLFPNPAVEPSEANPQGNMARNVARDSAEDVRGDWAMEGYRPTVVHNLPEFFSQPIPQIAPAEQGEITFGRVLFHLFLLGLTVLTTLAVGFVWLGGFWNGIVYSFTVLSILGAHEMGHYIACRWYG